ncbi:MAG: hypothetical protein IJ783_00215 [Kiritimatiellae bacterium]|nr:hypothetical protein [Kiritimatiellia bacterium]
MKRTPMFAAALAAALFAAEAAGRPAGPADAEPVPFPAPDSAMHALRVVNWNVENLFDAVENQEKDPETQKAPDWEFTPQSWRHWTESRYRTKLERLAWAIDKMKPDVLAVEEVENRATVDALVETLREKHGWTLPHVAHEESNDHRGIDVAILSRYPIVSQRYLPKTGPRGLLRADVDADGARLVVFALHWKSQLGDKSVNAAVRRNEAASLRKAFADALAENPDAAIVALGDCNEMVNGLAQVSGLETVETRAEALESANAGPGGFRPYNLVNDIPEERRGTFFWNQSHAWNTLDGIIVAPRMLLPAEESGPVWRASDPAATAGFAVPEMRWHDGRPNAYRRSRKYASGTGGDEVEGETSYTGYSDHFPLVTVLARVEQAAPPAAEETAEEAPAPEAAEEAPAAEDGEEAAQAA